ncbi:hypothetical protein BDZ94DRAFT_1355041 [Collybia nuda]|uniref:Uncharacterized protein n=1 Tax=Collybia nuda TaxID=64659 RepID=A0A9P6CJG4_9AGAR|nr:hypothetical protein BDZ94DRAFT_1355041 [Collybia nuda]
MITPATRQESTMCWYYWYLPCSGIKHCQANGLKFTSRPIVSISRAQSAYGVFPGGNRMRDIVQIQKGHTKPRPLFKSPEESPLQLAACNVSHLRRTLSTSSGKFKGLNVMGGGSKLQDARVHSMHKRARITPILREHFSYLWRAVLPPPPMQP